MAIGAAGAVWVTPACGPVWLGVGLPESDPPLGAFGPGLGCGERSRAGWAGTGAGRAVGAAEPRAGAFGSGLAGRAGTLIGTGTRSRSGTTFACGGSVGVRATRLLTEPGPGGFGQLL